MKYVNKIAIAALAVSMMAPNANAFWSKSDLYSIPVNALSKAKLAQAPTSTISNAISHVCNNPVAYGVGAGLVFGASAVAGTFKVVKNRKAAKLAAEKATKLAAEKATKLAAEKAANVSRWSKAKEFGTQYFNNGKSLIKNAWAGCTKENGKKALNATVNFVKDNKVTNHLSANKKAYAIGTGIVTGTGLACYAGYKALQRFGWFNNSTKKRFEGATKEDLEQIENTDLNA